MITVFKRPIFARSLIILGILWLLLFFCCRTTVIGYYAGFKSNNEFGRCLENEQVTQQGLTGKPARGRKQGANDVMTEIVLTWPRVEKVIHELKFLVL